MNSREQILEKIRHNKPSSDAHPDSFDSGIIYHDPVTMFGDVLASVGGKFIWVEDFDAIKSGIDALFPNIKKVVNSIPELALGDVNIHDIKTPHELENINLSIIYGELGVAENAAIWVGSDRLPYRVLPFICQHLIIVIRSKDIVSNMHQAYDKIKVDLADYGVFIAGPSKTADIEQSLVIGAHGPRSLTVFCKM